MISHAYTRRGALSAIAMTSAAVATVAVPALAAQPHIITPELAALLRQHKLAHERVDEFYAQVWNPACKMHEAELASVPHVEATAQGYLNVLGEETPAHVYSTARHLDVARCKSVMSGNSAAWSTDPRWQETRRAARRITVAAKWRERRLSRIQMRWDAGRYREREDEAWGPINEAQEAIRLFPVQSLADLQAKLAHIADTCDGDDGMFELVRRDVDALMRKGAS